MKFRQYEPGEDVPVVKYLSIALVVIVVTVVVIWSLQWLTADVRGELDQREQTRADGTYRIAAYERFYDKCASVQALEDQIDNTEADESLPENQKATNLLALRNQRNALIREYNADARKEDTRGNFLASDLPYELNPDEETTCTT